MRIGDAGRLARGGVDGAKVSAHAVDDEEAIVEGGAELLLLSVDGEVVVVGVVCTACVVVRLSAGSVSLMYGRPCSAENMFGRSLGIFLLFI